MDLRPWGGLGGGGTLGFLGAPLPKPAPQRIGGIASALSPFVKVSGVCSVLVGEVSLPPQTSLSARVSSSRIGIVSFVFAGGGGVRE